MASSSDGFAAPAGERADAVDRALLARVARQDESALAALYDRHARVLYALALRIVGDRELAQEVLQDSLLRCWTGAERYDSGRGPVVAWLLGVTRHRAIDTLRSRPHQARLREKAPLPADDRLAGAREPDGEDTVLLRRAMTAALAALAPAQREAIELAYYSGLTQTEIARVQGEPLGTVKSRMRSGLERLRAALSPMLQS
jgi:RNA polymerase sigma-70 factor (ECF subfamily)